MVICKFFLQGTCKFGANCKFEHQLNTDHTYTNPSILLQNYNTKPQTNASIDTNTLVKAVVNDMTVAEKGGQWLLSSYAPFRDKPPFPGFEDHSMEEIRCLYYESMKNGTLDQYKQNLQMMLQQAVMKIKALQNPSPDAVAMLKTLYETPSSNATNSNQTPFGGTTTNSVFGAKPTQNTVFGSTTPNQNIFGSVAPNQNIFANTSTPQKSIFGGAANSTSLFGNTNSSSIFGGQTNNQNKSLFGSQQQTDQAKSIFGTQPTNTPLFGGSNSIFGGATQQSTFAQATSPFGQNQPLFGTAPTQNIFQQSANQFGTPTNVQFSTTQPANGSFGTTSTTSPFGAQTTATSPFGTVQTTTSPFGTAQTTTTSPFGIAPTTTTSPFGIAQTTTTSPFGTAQTTTTSPFGTAQTTTTSPFGTAQTTTTSPFGTAQTTTTSPFGTSQTANNPFGTTQPAFSAPQSTGGLFGTQTTSSPFVHQNTFVNTEKNQFGNTQVSAATQNKPSFQHTQNIFGNLMQQTLAKPIQIKPNEEFYSKIEELTEEEISWFQSDDLDIMKIPEKPPTYEMCFKV